VTTEELERHVDRLVQELDRELKGQVPEERIIAVAHAHYESLNRRAAFNDFVPLLVYRFAKEDLVTSRHDELQDAA
jgi:hypothetical protein